MSETIKREQCPNCAIRGDDKSCNNLCTFNQNGQIKTRCVHPACNYSLEEKKNISVIGGYQDLIDRKISKNTCMIYDYQVGKYKNKDCHIANTRNEKGEVISQHIRFLEEKSFEWINYNNSIVLFGQHIDFDFSKPLIITEGQIDAMSCYEMGYQAISLTHGIETAKQGISNSKKYLEQFNKIIFWLDSDNIGKEILQKILPLAPLGKTYYIINDKYKDANEVLVNHPERDYFKNLIDNCIESVPSGIIFGKDLDLEDYLKPLPEGFKTGRKEFDKKTRGYQLGQLYLFMGGSGIGKSSIIRNDVLLLREQYKLKTASYFLEESQRTTPLGYIALSLGIPVGDFVQNPLKFVSKKELEDKWNILINSNEMVFRDIEGEINSLEFLNKIEYLAKYKGFKVFVLDHIQLLIGAQKSIEGERRDIDIFMEKFYNLVVRYQLIGIIVCQLSNPFKGLDWEEGREVMQSDARGSASLRFKPDVIIGVERNMRDVQERDKMILRIVKNRWYGDLGVTDEIRMIENTGKLEVL